MTLKLITILIPPLCLPSSLQAEKTKESPNPYRNITVSLEGTSSSRLNHLQEIHNFQLTFDDPTFGGIPYEPFE